MTSVGDRGIESFIALAAAASNDLSVPLALISTAASSADIWYVLANSSSILSLLENAPQANLLQLSALETW
jgi:hypothetical protein